MSIAEVKENVINLMNIIARRSDTIERMNGSKSLIEIDLAMEDIRILYRELDRLRKFTEVESMSGSAILRDHTANVPRTQSPIPANTNSPHPGELYRNDPKPAESISSEKQADKNFEAPPDRDQQVKPTFEPDVVKQPSSNEPSVGVNQQTSQDETKQHSDEKQPSTNIQSNIQDSPLPLINESIPQASATENKKTLVGERFSTDKGSIHERLAQIRDDKSIGMRMQSKPVANIKDAIGLNEKFLFINELFGGDISAYNNAINDLNTRASIHDAFEMLNNLTEEYKWDGERSAETIEKFANLVQRRYMA